MSKKRYKHAQSQGIVSKNSSRISKSGDYAHSFFIGNKKYTIFTSDNLSPVTDGDRVLFEYEERTRRSGYHAKYNAVIMETLTIEAPSELEENIDGFVYILSNQSMPGLLKIGYTTGTATKRANELSRVTSIPTGFKVEWTLPVSGNPRSVEQTAHAHLARNRHGKEFFKVSLDKAKEACISSFVKLYPEKASLMDEAFSVRAKNELKRRDHIAQITAEMERQKKAEKDRKAYEQTAEGMWYHRGVCRMIAHNFISEPNRGFPSFISKLFGAKFEDFMEFEIQPVQKREAMRWIEEIEWSVFMSGRKLEKYIGERSHFPTKDDCLDFVSRSVHQHGIDNYKVTIDIPNNLVENPPTPTVFFKNNYCYMPVESIDNLVIRPFPTNLKKGCL
jgi:hypothetical protein